MDKQNNSKQKPEKVYKPNPSKIYKVVIALMITIALLFLWAFTTENQFWQGFALNLLTEIIGAVVFALLVDLFLKGLVKEYMQQAKRWNEILFLQKELIKFLEIKEEVLARMKEKEAEKSAK